MHLAAQPDLLPRPPGGMGRGAALAALVHAGLLAALALGLQWRVSTPSVVSAELWSSVPQVAAPQGAAPVEPLQTPPPAEPPAPVPVAPPAPPPAPAPSPPEPPAARAEPPKPDIVVERQRREREARENAERDAAALRERQRREEALRQEREKQARERAEAERQARLKKEREQRERAEREAREERERKLAAERQRKEEAAAAERMARQREDNLRRMQEQIGGATGRPGGTGSQAADAAPSSSYAGRLVMHIKPNIVFTETPAGNPAAEVEVRASPAGTILSRRLLKPSGHAEWDEAVLRAIDRTGTLPRDIDGRVPSAVVIVFRPRE